MRRIAPLIVCAVLAACDQSPGDRIAELDDAVTVDCGKVTSEYPNASTAQQKVGCMNDALAAGVHAKVMFTYEIDIVTRVYTVDGAFVHLEGYTELQGDEHYIEFRCAAFEAPEKMVGTMTYYDLGTTDCETVREW